LAAFGRKRMIDELKPITLRSAIRFMAEIIAEPKPTSVVEYSLATIIQKKKPREVVTTLLATRYRAFLYSDTALIWLNLRSGPILSRILRMGL